MNEFARDLLFIIQKFNAKNHFSWIIMKSDTFKFGSFEVPARI